MNFYCLYFISPRERSRENIKYKAFAQRRQKAPLCYSLSDALCYFERYCFLSVNRTVDKGVIQRTL